MSEENDYYKSKRSELFAQFDEFNKRIEKLVGQKYGEKFANTVAEEIKKKYEFIYDELPYIGGDNNPLTTNLVSGVQNLAMYLVLRRHDKPLKDIGEIAYKACEELFNSHPELAPKTSLEFIPFIRNVAEESQEKKYPEDWVYLFVEGDGDFDYGMDFTECALVKLFHKYDANDFTPYLCAMDIIMSDVTIAGLHRTETLAEGGERCDFRYKDGKKTDVASTVIKN